MLEAGICVRSAAGKCGLVCWQPLNRLAWISRVRMTWGDDGVFWASSTGEYLLEFAMDGMQSI